MKVLYPRCGGVDLHQATVVAAVRIAEGGPPQTEVHPSGTAPPRPRDGGSGGALNYLLAEENR